MMSHEEEPGVRQLGGQKLLIVQRLQTLGQKLEMLRDAMHERLIVNMGEQKGRRLKTGGGGGRGRGRGLWNSANSYLLLC